MHDVIVTYSSIPDRAAFSAYYRGTHAPLVRAMPELEEFAWGFVSDAGEDDPKLIARLTFPSRDAADRSFASGAGLATVNDVANFATEGVAVVHVPREQ